MPDSTQTPTPPPLLRVLDAPLAHHSPPPGPDLDAILAHNEQTLPSSDDMPLADGRIQQDTLSYSRDSLRFHFREQSDRVAVEGDMFVYYIGQDRAGLPAVPCEVGVALGRRRRAASGARRYRADARYRTRLWGARLRRPGHLRGVRRAGPTGPGLLRAVPRAGRGHPVRYGDRLAVDVGTRPRPQEAPLCIATRSRILSLRSANRGQACPGHGANALRPVVRGAAARKPYRTATEACAATNSGSRSTSATTGCAGTARQAARISSTTRKCVG